MKPILLALAAVSAASGALALTGASPWLFQVVETTPVEPLPATDDPGADAEDTCGAKRFADLIGQPATAIQAMLIQNPIRVVAPGSMLTMDLVPSRLNVHTDADGIVMKITCG